MQGRPPEVDEKIKEVVDSILQFANAIIDNYNGYTAIEIELAQNLHYSIGMYEKSKLFPSIKTLNQIMNEEIKAISEGNHGQDGQETNVSTSKERKGAFNCS